MIFQVSHSILSTMPTKEKKREQVRGSAKLTDRASFNQFLPARLNPRQHELAVALREIGRVKRTLFIIEWLLAADTQRRTRIGRNKGDAHHALKNALRMGRQAKIRDRTTEGQHLRMAVLNLLTTIIFY